MSAKKNAFVFHAVSSMLEQVKESITLVDDADVSHGIIISAALPNETDAGNELTTECLLWGSAADISNVLYAAAKHNKLFARALSTAGLRLATDKMAARVDAKAKEQGKIITMQKPPIYKPGEA